MRPDEYHRAAAASMGEIGRDGLQAEVEKACARLGLYCYHARIPYGSRKGWPDCVIMNMATGQMMFRELKSASGQLSSEQKAVGYALKAGGHDYAVWRPADWIGGHIGTALARLAGHRPRGPVAAPEGLGGPGAGGG
jgi:hypothetical protein